MISKIGVSEYKLDTYEYNSVKFKLSQLDEEFTFNEPTLNYNFLVKLNKFLFEDIYGFKTLENKNIKNNDIEEINSIFDNIIYSCIDKNYSELLKNIINLWEKQVLIIGNTRTLIGLLIIINLGYKLDLTIDSNINIVSSENIFKKIIPIPKTYKLTRF